MVNRREVLKAGAAMVVAGVAGRAVAREVATSPAGATERVERWDVFEVNLQGPREGNPFLEVWVKGRFKKGAREVVVEGFYDGEGVYKIRFMPDSIGGWSYVTESNVGVLAGKSGEFEVVEAGGGNRGPVRVRDTFHFGYADGTAYFPFGTTCYAWVHQSEERQEETLATLKVSAFNKIRMCIFPKWYQYNRTEPARFPFVREGGKNDYARFDVEFFRGFEKRILDLRAIGVEADLILFHPYDKWGFSEMPEEVDERYLKYVMARLGAYRNVWWSLANEYDLMRHKTTADWDRIAAVVTEGDVYGHLRSIHYSRAPYDYSRVWCTHAGVQDYAFEKGASWRETWRKPVVFDEMMYEGNIGSRWGNLSGEEMVRRFWLCVCAGCYGGHGETYVSEGEIEKEGAVLWWSHGGKLRGTSGARIAFLRKIVEETAGAGDGVIGLSQMDPVYYPGAKRSGDGAFLF